MMGCSPRPSTQLPRHRASPLAQANELKSKQGLKTCNISGKWIRPHHSDCTNPSFGRERGLAQCHAVEPQVSRPGYSCPRGTGWLRRPHEPSDARKGVAPQLLRLSYTSTLFSTDCLLLSSYPSMMCLSKHRGYLTFGTLFTTPRHTAHGQSQQNDSFFSPLFFFSSVVAKTLQEPNSRWHSMPAATRNTQMWKKTDAYDFLLHFRCGTGTSQQAFNGMFQHR